MSEKNKFSQEWAIKRAMCRELLFYPIGSLGQEEVEVISRETKALCIPYKGGKCPEYASKQRWIPVSEHLPNAYTPVLVYSEGRTIGKPFIVQAELHEGLTQNGETVLEWVWMCDPDYEYRSFYEGGDPTHWMPLPEAPK